jgi:hypothetical protein
VNKSLTRYVLALLLILPLIAACRQSAQPVETAAGAEIALEIEPQPPVVGMATLRVIVTDSDGQPVEDASVDVRGDMDHAGMVPVLGTAEASNGDGQYVIPFEWTMAGDWIVTVTVTLPRGEVAAEEFTLTVGSNGMDMDADAHGE